MKRSLLLLVAAPLVSICLADTPRVLPPGEVPRDARLEPLKDLDGYFPFTPPASREPWAARSEAVRQQVHVALGIWPPPTKTPLNAVVHSRIEQDDYTVENVFFESMPGLFVTGNLYRPKGRKGLHPAVLAPHGHWAEARFALLSDNELEKELQIGGERLAQGGRSKFQALGSHLARMGCVAFVYDMLGYCDSKQISFELAHKFARQRPEMNFPAAWGLYSPPAESRLQSVIGLQTWNSIRALDFLTSLPDVDPRRLACTGASGGGTQTFLLGAVDPRLTVAFPAVMVSTAMQGGCTCENASLLRTGTGNIELAGLFAPKPLGMTTANDWTKEMPTKGFPELRKLYALLGAPEAVRLWHMPHFQHNYNAPTREGIYAWFNEHFDLGLPGDQLVEREYPVLTREQLTVWNAPHPQPRSGPDFERDLLRWWDADARLQVGKSLAEFRRIAHPAWKAIIGRTLENAGNVKQQRTKAAAATGYAGAPPTLALLRNETFGEEVPVTIFRAKKPSAPVVLWLSASGKAGVLENGRPRAEVTKLVEAGTTVVALDLFKQGEFLREGESDAPTRRVKNPREAAAYTFGYNHALLAQRVHDVLTAAAWLRDAEEKPEWIAIVSLDSTAPIAAAAAAIAGPAIDALVVDTQGFRFAAVRDLHDASFLPGSVKYGDVPGLLALGAPHRLFLMGEDGKPPEIVNAAYDAAEVRDRLQVSAGHDPQAAVQWLLRGK